MSPRFAVKRELNGQVLLKEGQKKPSIRFKKQVTVILIPQRHEYHAANCDLWWSASDFYSFHLESMRRNVKEALTSPRPTKELVDNRRFSFESSTNSECDSLIIQIRNGNEVSKKHTEKEKHSMRDSINSFIKQVYSSLMLCINWIILVKRELFFKKESSLPHSYSDEELLALNVVSTKIEELQNSTTPTKRNFRITIVDILAIIGLITTFPLLIYHLIQFVSSITGRQ